jgi:SAM-dependent methyltransferase
MSDYSARRYWQNVGRELLRRPEDDESTIASDDTPYYALKQARFFEDFLDPALEDADTVLEVGQGPGGNLARLLASGKRVAGADVSPSMIELARRRIGKSCLVQMDGAHLPFEDGAYDAVFTSTVLQHNPPHAAGQLLSEIARVAGSAVHLFEDTAEFYLRDRRSHWLRPAAWYISRMREHGYVLQYRKRLPLCYQEVAGTAARVIVDRRMPQGAPPSRQRVRVEAGLLRVAGPMDRMIPPVLGLTRLSFVRAESGARTL